MPTTAEVIQIAKISQYLASNDIAKGSLFGARIDPMLDIILYLERTAVEWAYNQNPNYEGIYETTQYLYWLCGKYKFKAQYILANGSGGTIAPVVPMDDCCLTIYPIYITAADLDENGNYINSQIVGDNVIVFFNDNDEKWHRAGGDWFEYTENGIRITAAYDETYTWIIQKLGTSDSQPIDTPSVVNYNLTENDTLIENIVLSEEGQLITIAIIPNEFTYNWDTNFIFGDTPPIQTPNGANTLQLFTFQYIAAANKLLCVGQSLNIPHS